MQIKTQAAPFHAEGRRGETHQEGRGVDRRAMVDFNDAVWGDGPPIGIVNEKIVAERRLAVARRLAERVREAKRTAWLIGGDDTDVR